MYTIASTWKEMEAERMCGQEGRRRGWHCRGPVSEPELISLLSTWSWFPLILCWQILGHKAPMTKYFPIFRTKTYSRMSYRQINTQASTHNNPWIGTLEGDLDTKPIKCHISCNWKIAWKLKWIAGKILNLYNSFEDMSLSL